MLKLLFRLYERNSGTGEYRGTLLLALTVVVLSIGTLAVLARLSFHEIYTAEGTLEPGRIAIMQSEADGAIRQNQLRLGTPYELNEPVFTMAVGDGTERVYTAPCQCVITRSDFLQRATGAVQVGELIAEFVDTRSLMVRFPVDGRWTGTVAPGSKVHVLDAEGASLEGAVERVYLRRNQELGLEAVASIPGSASLAPGSQVTVRVVVPPVSLWQFFVESLKRRGG